MRVAQQVVQPALQTHGGQSTDHHGAAIGPGHAMGLRFQRPDFTGRQHLAGIAGGGRVSRAHRQVHGFRGTVFAAFCGDGDVASAHLLFGGDFQHGNLIGRAGEGQCGFALLHLEQVFIGVHGQGDCFQAVVGDKHGNRQRHAFARPQHPWQGAQHRQRLGDGNVLFGLAVGAVVTGHHHGPHLAHVRRQGNLVIGGFIGIQRERAQELHHRREAATLLFPAIVSPVGAAQCQQLIQLCPVGPHHHVEQIPGQHAKGFATVETVVRVRGLVVGQAKQALIHQRQGVGHRLALLFTDLHGKGVFRFHLVGGAHLRGKTGIRVIHQ